MLRKWRGKRAVHAAPLAELLLLGLPTHWFLNAAPNESYQKRRSSSHDEHGSPAVAAADKVVGCGGQEKSKIIACVHQCRAHGTALLRPVFSAKPRPDGPFSTDTYSRQQSKQRKSPHSRSESP